ncbi:response regulator [Panacibacter sp. DH6]|uniref:histidine kinase n=1 Tax=Panacibacter microcysteis TaxID=2793269 RepID=A0A931E6V0_9BACT|nr:ATP-binding protein [Panacibacter microcysteis]MBG9376536.1 response regulator [Panacibacter microcysteis]
MELTEKKFPPFLSGGGEMGERIRNFDWSKTSLGEPHQWDESLKTCIRIMLSSTQPIWIGWGSDLIKFYNDPYKAIVGGKHPHALGMPARIVWSDIWSDIEPMLKKVMEEDTGTYVESQLLIMERYGYKEETYYTFSYTPVLGNDLKPAGMICYNTADTERILNERALETLKQLNALIQKDAEDEVYRQAINAISSNTRDFPFAIVYKIAEDMSFAEAIAWTGFEPGNMESPVIIDLRNSDLPNFRTAVFEQKTVVSKNTGRWKDLPKGTWDIMPDHYVHVPIKSATETHPLAIMTFGLNPYRKFDGRFENFIRQIADQVTLNANNALAYQAEKKRKEALEELDRAKTIFFTNISHEFRTPLTLILGNLDEIVADKFVTAGTLDKLIVTRRNALRLLKLVNTLLDFSRIESGRHLASFTKTDIVAITKNLTANFTSVIDKAGLSFEINAQPIQQAVYVDRQMWEKIIFNLLSNAFKYTLTGGISVKLFTKEEQLVLQVKDTGVGIPQQELPLIFDRFHRVQNVVGRSHEGTGIGLSLIKELVQLHGGSITAESEPGRGSIFTVNIPLGKDHLPASQVNAVLTEETEIPEMAFVEEVNVLVREHTSKDLPARDVSNKLPILVADDNADMLHYLQSLLENEYTVITAVNGVDALQKVEAHKPYLVLSDVMMPVMNGIELLKTIKANVETESIPVILLTARAGEESMIEGYEIGADDYLVKPFSAKELLARIRAHIKIIKTKRHLQSHLREFFMQAPVSIGVVKGPNHVWEIVNQNMLKISGRQTIEELLGKPLFKSIPEGAGQGYEEVFDSVYKTGHRVVFEETSLDLIRKGNKETVYLKIIFEPYRNEDGVVTGVMFIAYDITEHVTARKRVEESEYRFKGMANEAPIFVWLTDKDLRTTFLNKTGLTYFGYPENADISKLSWKTFIHPEDLAHVLDAMHQSAIDKTPYSIEIRLRNEEAGEYRWFLDKGVPRYENNSFIGFVGTSMDIHDQKIKEQAKDEFISIAGHELKTPLTSAKAYLQIACDALNKEKANSVEYVERAANSLDKLNRLIAELLDMSRIQNGKLQLNLAPFNFQTLISSVLESVQPTSKHHILHNGNADVTVTGDRERLQQVLINLLNNAIKYSPGAGYITVHTIIVDHNIRVAVKDSGIGIARNNLNKIFQRFYRVDETGKAFHGLGIGLYVAADIIQRHGGKLWAESELGKGSTFFFEIPLN